MTRSVRGYLIFGMTMLGAGSIIALSPPSAVADGGLSGTGGGTLTGPGGAPIGSAGAQVNGIESVPGGLNGIPGCISGGCTGSLTTVASVGTGPGATQFGSPGLQASIPAPTIPGGNPINCITVGCMGSLSTSGGVSTPIVGATGSLDGLIHG
jgi:hypothetical protein